MLSASREGCPRLSPHEQIRVTGLTPDREPRPGPIRSLLPRVPILCLDSSSRHDLLRASQLSPTRYRLSTRPASHPPRTYASRQLRLPSRLALARGVARPMLVQPGPQPYHGLDRTEAAMHNGQTHHDASPQSASVSAHPDRHLPPEPESDYQSDDDLDTGSHNGATGSKRKRPISVSYVSLLDSVFPLLPLARFELSVIVRLHLTSSRHRIISYSIPHTPLPAPHRPLGTWRRHPMSAYCPASCLPALHRPPSQLGIDLTGVGLTPPTGTALLLPLLAMVSRKTTLTARSLGVSSASSARYFLSRVYLDVESHTDRCPVGQV